MSALPGSLAAARAAPAPDAETCTLSNDLGWALGMVFRGYVKATHEALGGLPGGPRGYQVLATAAQDEHGSQLALAQRLGVDQRTVMTYLLDDLEAAGLIERRPDPADRRARRIVATPHGRTTLTHRDQQLRAAEEQLLSGLDGEEDRQLFRRLLARAGRAPTRRTRASTACEPAADLRETPTAAGRRRPGGGGTMPCYLRAHDGPDFYVGERGCRRARRPRLAARALPRPATPGTATRSRSSGLSTPRRPARAVGHRRTALGCAHPGQRPVSGSGLPGRSVLLAQQGDYVVFHGVNHSWHAEEPSVVLAVRWPSVSRLRGPGVRQWNQRRQVGDSASLETQETRQPGDSVS